MAKKLDVVLTVSVKATALDQADGSLFQEVEIPTLSSKLGGISLDTYNQLQAMLGKAGQQLTADVLALGVKHAATKVAK